jgi:5-formyltetrahydrofolate cyclo-ligase
VPANGAAEHKRALREQVLAARAALAPAERARRSAAIGAHLLALPQLAHARTIAAYLSFGEEFDTAAVIAHWLARGQRVALPRVVDHHLPASRHLALHAVADIASDTIAGRWGIREPDPQRCPPVRAEDLDAVLVPGLAFDASGGRLGYGAGYYDRLLAGVRADCLIVAAAFSLQCVAQVPMQAHDRRIALLVTEDGPRRSP